MKRTAAKTGWAASGAVLSAVVSGVCLLGLVGVQGQTTAPTTAAAPGEPGEAPHPSAPAAANEPGGMMDQAANAGSQVYVDDSFASIEKLRAAIRYANQGQAELAINAYQGIIDAYGQKLVYLNNDSYLSITDYVRGKLLEMPAVRSGMYDQLLGVRAKKEIDKAIAARDLPGLIRACDQYFPSTAAYGGLTQAAAWHFERAEFAAAARLWEELERHPTVGGHKADLLFRAAIAESLQGNTVGAVVLRGQLAKEFPNATGVVDGADSPLLAKLDGILAQPAWESGRAELAAKDEWPAFQGGPTRTNVLSVNASIGAQLWSTSLNGGGEATGRSLPGRLQRVNGKFMARQRMMQPGVTMEPRLVSYPVMSGGMLLVHTGDRVMALSANAGTFAWAYPDQGGRSEAVRPPMPGEGEGMPLQPAEHDSVCVWGDRAFAVLPAVQPGRQPTSDDEVEGGLPTATRVVCLDRATGHERWSTPAQSVKLSSKGILTFVGSPMATRQGVFAMARKLGDGAFVQLYLVRLDAETGKPTWSCYLCSASAGMYYGMGANFANIPIPTLVDDVLYVATGQGATCAVDANVGRILWLQINDAAKKQRSANEYYNPQQIAPSWKFNAPLVHGDRVVGFEAAAGESTLTVYNRWTGKPVRVVTAKDVGATSLDVVAGILGSQLILTGGKVMALDLDKIEETTTPVWTCDYPAGTEAGKPEGRPFLTAGGLYVPFEKGMMVVDTKSGKAGDFWQWPKTQRDVAGKPGNFLVTSEQVVVVSDTDVAGYSRWETARDNRLAQIQARPEDPSGYLALAEIAFRTNHMDLSQENMKRAVELATGSGAAGGDAAGQGEGLGRLYRTCLNFAEQLLERTPNEVRDGARFYYEQCRATARTPEQQAEWRLSMSDLSLAQNKPEEAATLYNEVLTDPAMRSASFHRGEGLARAGVSGELKFRALIEKNGPSVYRRFEDQAATLEAAGQVQRDAAQLQQVIDAYPNSAASLVAASQLAAVYHDKQDWLGQVKALRWLYPRADEKTRPQVTADLAAAHLALKRYAGALAWTERGLRQYKDFSWEDGATHASMTFAKLRDALHESSAGVAEGRRPMLPPPQTDASGRPLLGPAMDETSATAALTTGMMLVPLEQGPALRRPDKLFVHRLRSILMYDPSHPSAEPARVDLAQNGQAALLGSVGDVSVVVQARTATGIDTRKNTIAWQVPLTGTGAVTERVAGGGNGGRRIIRQLNGGQIIIQGGGQLIINGNAINSGDVDVNMDAAASLADPEVMRQIAFSRLGRPSFSTIRIFNNKLVVIANGALTAYDVMTGKPAWQDAAGAALAVKLPAGVPTVLSGNEDVLVAEVDSVDRNSTTFFVVDAETGKFRKQINLEDEHAQWRSVGEDGTLYCVTDQSVEAYDLFSEQDKPLWRRSDIQSKFPVATVLTLDGLMLVNTNLELMCLSQDGGEVRWPTAAQGPIRIKAPEPQFIRATADGDQVVYETDQGIMAYHTFPQEDDQVAWRGTITPGQFPPFESFELSDTYVVVMAAGPTNGGVQHAVKLVLYNRKGGRLHAIENISNGGGGAAGDGPVITAWQALDNGIAMQMSSGVRFYHGKGN